MKRTLGANPYLFPMPTTIVGAKVNGKENYTTVVYTGIVQHDPPLISVSLSRPHLTNKGIKENKCFSVNIPNTRMLRQTDFIGMYSGKKIDKSKIFESFYGELEHAPMIYEAPVNLECRLVGQLDYDGSAEIFIGEIVQTYSSDRFMKKGVLDIKRIDPFVFSIHSNYFYKIGRRLSKAWYSGLSYKEKVKVALEE